MYSRTLVAALAATTMLAGGFAYAADQPHGQMSGGQMAMPPGHAAAVKDFGKLSADGARGYQDVKLARLAIFDGDIGDAKTIAARAEAEFDKAKTDDAVFTKAEAEMRTRMVSKTNGTADAGKAGTANGAQADSGKASQTDTAKSDTAKSQGAAQGNGGQDVSKPVAWLPVDGVVGVAEDYSAQPAKAQAVAKANDSLAKGDKRGAMDTLRLAGVDLEVVTAVVPLQQTLGDIHDAVQMIDAGKYYEGSQKLRAVETSTILISANTVEVPAGQTAGHAATGASAAKPAGK